MVGALRAVAQGTQGPIRRLLEQRGIPYRSFFIVNMIKINADRALLDELAAREDVARIDANPQVRGGIPERPALNGMLRQSEQQSLGVEWNIARSERSPGLDHGISR